MKITENTIIGDIVKMGPRAIEILLSFGMGCIGCPASQRESLKDAAAVHGIDLSLLIKSLNNIE